MPEQASISRRRFLKGAAWGAAAITLGDLAVDSGWIEVVHQSLRLPNWRAGTVRVGLLTDPHINTDPALELAERGLNALRGQKLDVLLLGGDFINFYEKHQVRRLERFAKHALDLGVPTAAVLGNHDYASTQLPAVLQSFQHCGLRVLRNEAMDLDGCQIFGYDDALYGRFAPETLSARRQSHSTIALLHEPDFVSEVPRHASLQLSGHSHGGQVCLPFGIAPHTPRGARDYVAGFYEKAPVPLYVSRGVGTTGPPFRLFCRPEVTILELSAA